MKNLFVLLSVAALGLSLAGCATEEELRRRDAERAREDARYDAEDRRRNAQDYEDYLEDYARDLGKKPSQLTSAERADARREYRDRGSHRRGYRYGYWW